MVASPEMGHDEPQHPWAANGQDDMRGASRRLLLMIAGPAVLFCGAEIVLRAIGPAPPATGFRDYFLVNDEMEMRGAYVKDSELFWRALPSRHIRGWAKTTIALNSLGLRGPEPEQPKPPGRLRVAVAGDSCAFGLGVAEDEALYIAIATRALNGWATRDGRYTSADWVNGGISGYSSFQGHTFVRNVLLPLEPDLVVVGYGLNDYLYSARRRDAEIEMPPPWLLELGTLLERSELYVRLREVISPGRPPLESELVGSIPPRRVSPEELRVNLEAIVGEVRRGGARPVLMTMALRPRLPLVLNPVFLPRGDRWLRVFGVLIGGRQAYSMTEWPGTEAELLTLIRETPELPLPHYFLGVLLARRGDPHAAAELALARELDTERQTVAAYNGVIAAAAKELKVPLLDQAALFSADENFKYFLDERHLNVAGHRRLGEALADLIVQMD
ncbi:MAG: SGNH/GDSL hydrolase family protein [Planctomycetota bacterium]